MLTDRFSRHGFQSRSCRLIVFLAERFISTVKPGTLALAWRIEKRVACVATVAAGFHGTESTTQYDAGRIVRLGRG